MTVLEQKTEKLTPRQERALIALLHARTVGEAAQAAGIGERAVYRWLAHSEAFQAAYRQARREVVLHAIVQVQQSTGLAVQTLCTVMADADAPASARVHAARAVLEMAMRGVEIEDFGARLAVLEARINTIDTLTTRE